MKRRRSSGRVWDFYILKKGLTGLFEIEGHTGAPGEMKWNRGVCGPKKYLNPGRGDTNIWVKVTVSAVVRIAMQL